MRSYYQRPLPTLQRLGRPGTGIKPISINDQRSRNPLDELPGQLGGIGNLRETRSQRHGITALGEVQYLIEPFVGQAAQSGLGQRQGHNFGALDLENVI